MHALKIMNAPNEGCKINDCPLTTTTAANFSLGKFQPHAALKAAFFVFLFDGDAATVFFLHFFM